MKKDEKTLAESTVQAPLETWTALSATLLADG
jgi:hypothetical protein